MSVPLVLASGSESRRRMLEAAGVAFEVVPPAVDEEGARASLLAKKASPSEIATALAELKAMSVSKEKQGALVLGADQLLVCDGAIYGKARDMKDAKRILQSLRGRKHELLTAAVIVKNGAPLWQRLETAQLWMRDFSDAFLDSYIATEKEALFTCVGCYRLEGRGGQLFSRVEGDSFTIQGLPLLAALEALREAGVIAP